MDFDDSDSDTDEVLANVAFNFEQQREMLENFRIVSGIEQSQSQPHELPQVGSAGNNIDNSQPSTPGIVKPCGNCGSKSHRDGRSSLCPKNKNYKGDKQQEAQTTNKKRRNEQEDEEQPSTSSESESGKKKRKKTPCDCDASTVHYSKASQYCLKRIVRQSERHLDKKKRYEVFVIKCGLRQFCTNDDIFRIIQDDVTVVSSMMIEASIYINFLYHQGNIDGTNDEKPPSYLDYFYPLKVPKGRQAASAAMDPIYQDFRGMYNLQLYEATGRSYLIHAAAKQYEICVKNNVTMHMQKRIKRYFKKVLRINDPTPIVNYLFCAINQRGQLEGANQVAYNTFQDRFHIRSFYNFESKWWKFIQFLIQLKNCFYTNNPRVKSFKALPIFKPGRKHILYCDTAFRELLSNPLIKKGKTTNYRDPGFDSKPYWKEIFKIGKHEATGRDGGKNRVFAAAISTNGVDVSIHMHKEIKPDKPARKIDLQNITLKVGVDPGAKLIISACMHRTTNPTGHTILEWSSKKWHNECRYYKHQQKANKWSKSLLDEAEDDRKANFHNATELGDDFVNFTSHALKFFTRRQQLFSQSKFARLKFDHYIARQKAFEKLADELAPRTERTLIIFGTTTIAPCIRGYIKSPLQRIFDILQERKNCYIIQWDEFRTTLTCNACNEFMEVPKICREFECEVCGLVYEFNEVAARKLRRCFHCKRNETVKIHDDLRRSQCIECHRVYGRTREKCVIQDCGGEVVQVVGYKHYKNKFCDICKCIFYFSQGTEEETCPNCRDFLKKFDNSSRHRYRYCSKFSLLFFSPIFSNGSVLFLQPTAREQDTVTEMQPAIC